MYIGVAAILDMLPSCCELTFVSPTDGGSTQKLVLIGQAVSEKFLKMDIGTWVFNKLTLWA